MMPKLLPPHSPQRAAKCCILPLYSTNSTKKPKSIIPPWVARQTFVSLQTRSLAQPRHGLLNEPWPDASTTFFSQTGSFWPDGQGPGEKDHEPPDERILKLGKTLRILSPLLPNLLTNPLPPDILSPNVTLHLFPSTHPHLPTVKGRTLYRAALWTVPVAWSSVPLVGNVKLQILSERIVRAGTVMGPGAEDSEASGGDERLVVRWKTEPKGSNDGQQHLTTSSSSRTSPSSSPSSPSAKKSGANHTSHSQGDISPASASKAGTNRGLSVLLGGEAPIFKLSHEEQFSGLFIFSFDEAGRILTHTIEHADDAHGWDRTAKFVTLTDWLIGKARSSLGDPAPTTRPGLAIQGCSGCDEADGDAGLVIGVGAFGNSEVLSRSGSVSASFQ